MGILKTGEIDNDRLDQSYAIGPNPLTPGSLVTMNSSGNVIAHPDAGQNVAPYVLLEDFDRHRGIDQDWISGENANLYIPRPGDVLEMFIASGQTGSPGRFLESDGNGSLQQHVPQAVDESGSGTYELYFNSVHFQAMQPFNNTSGNPNRIIVRCVN